MKKLLSYLLNPLYALGIGGVFFAIAFVNSVMVNASSMADLSWWGKGACVGFSIVLTVLFIRFFLLPIGKWFISLVN